MTNTTVSYAVIYIWYCLLYLKHNVFRGLLICNTFSSYGAVCLFFINLCYAFWSDVLILIYLCNFDISLSMFWFRFSENDLKLYIESMFNVIQRPPYIDKYKIIVFIICLIRDKQAHTTPNETTNTLGWLLIIIIQNNSKTTTVTTTHIQNNEHREIQTLFSSISSDRSSLRYFFLRMFERFSFPILLLMTQFHSWIFFVLLCLGSH